MREMKNSGIEWVGTIPSNWMVMPNKRIMHKQKVLCDKYNGEDILSLTMNGVIVRNLDAGGKVPATFDGYQIVCPNNLLMCLFDYDVTPRCIGLIKNNGLTSPAYSQFVVDNGNIPSYYYYYYLMIDNTKELLHLAKNLRHSFTEEQLGEIYVSVPPINEQEKIAKFLNEKVQEIDNAIEKTKETIEDYKKLKQTIITKVVTKGLDKNAVFKDSNIDWIGDIPSKWMVCKIKHLGTSRNGLTYSPEDICEKDKGILVLRSSNIKDGKLCFEDNVYVDKEIKEELKVNVGDIVICSRNGSKSLIGKNALIEENMDATFGAFMMIFRCKTNPKYFKYILDSDIFKYYLGTFLTSTINQLTYDNFSNMKIVYTENIKEQNEMVEFLDNKCSEIDSLIKSKEKIVEELEKYKKSVIYEYVTGKKEVK